MIGRERHERFWSSGGSGQFPGWSGIISLHVWQGGGAVATLEMLESQAGLGDKSQILILGSQGLCHPGPLETGLTVLMTPAPRGTGKLVGTDPETA